MVLSLLACCGVKGAHQLRVARLSVPWRGKSEMYFAHGLTGDATKFAGKRIAAMVNCELKFAHGWKMVSRIQ